MADIVLDPQGYRPFATLTEAAYAYIPAIVSVVRVGQYDYLRRVVPSVSTVPVAFTSNGGTVQWEPHGSCVYTGHYGLVGEDIGEQNGGVFPAATINVRTDLQNAMDAALKTGKPLVGDATKFYGVNSWVCFGARSGMTDVAPGAKMINVNVKAMAGSDWTAGNIDGADPDDWTPGTAVLYIGRHPAVTTGKYRAHTEGCTADGGDIASIGVHNLANPQSMHFRLRGQGAVCFSHMISVPNSTNQTNCTESFFIDCGGSEANSSDVDPDPIGETDKYWHYGQRTSCGLAVYGADMTIIRPRYVIHKINIALGTIINIGITDGIFWNGNHIASVANVVNLIVGQNAAAYRFRGCRWDEGGNVLRSFKGSFVDNHFHEYSGGDLLTMVAIAAGEKAGQFKFIGNYIGGASAVVKTTEGSGSWGAFDGYWAFNATQSGANFTIDGFVFVHNDNIAFDAAGQLYLNQQLVLSDTRLTVPAVVHPFSATLDCDSGTVAVVGSNHLLDASAAGTTNLATITGGVEGMLLYLSTANNARDINVQDGVGNIDCGSDRLLDNTSDTLTLMYRGGRWRMLSFASN